VVITEPFQGLAQAFAETFGAPGYHAVVVPHPVGSKDLEHLRRLADMVADVATRQLAGEDA
jgi:hypothetical protein